MTNAHTQACRRAQREATELRDDLLSASRVIARFDAVDVATADRLESLARRIRHLVARRDLLRDLVHVPEE